MLKSCNLFVSALLLIFSSVQTEASTCGPLDENGVTKILITAPSPVGQINLYSVQFDTLRKLPITSTALLNHLNHIKKVERPKNFRMFEQCPEVKGREQDCSVPFRFTDEQKQKSGSRYSFDRGHLVPAGPNKFSEEAAENTFFCINMAPQDPFVNQGPWAAIEDLAFKKFDNFPGYVITGLCDANSPDGPTLEGYLVPACYWKMLCYKEGGVGEVKVEAYIANNTIIHSSDSVGKKLRSADVRRARSQSEVEQLVKKEYIEKAWRDAATDLLPGRAEHDAPNPEECIAAKKLNRY